MDTPELHYQGANASKPGKYDAACASFLAESGQALDPDLQGHLKTRLLHQACSRHIAAGHKAFEHFQTLVGKRLARTGKNGKPLTPRRLFTMVAQEVFDRHGRMLAYVNARYDKQERETIPDAQRPTFNLQMMQDGHAVSLLIYPNIPKPQDLLLVQTAIHQARTRGGGKGMWKGPDSRLLLPYEFRWIIDTIRGARNGPDRYCADIATGMLYPPQQYYRVNPEDRLFFYPKHLMAALTMGFQLMASSRPSG